MEKQSTEEKPLCPRCNSVDTVAYFDIKRATPGSAAKTLHAIAEHVYRSYYPNARKCVDCEYVWW